jgi:hypothetical protein
MSKPILIESTIALPLPVPSSSFWNIGYWLGFLTESPERLTQLREPRNAF